MNRHTSNALVEQRNKTLANIGAAINYTAMGPDDGYIRLLQGESIRWANQLVNNSPITQFQKEHEIILDGLHKVIDELKRKNTGELPF